MISSFYKTSNEKKGAHYFDVRLKVFLIFFYSITIFFVKSISGILSYALVFLIYIILSKKIEFKDSPKKFNEHLAAILKVSFPLYIICILSFFSNSLIIENSNLIFSPTGASRGIFYSIRILLLGLFSIYIANTISIIEFNNVFKLCLYPLRRLKVPINEISMIVSIALRFIPEIFISFKAIKDAQWTRGAKMDYGNPLKRTKAYTSCFVPLLIKMINSCLTLGSALESRCFGLTETNPLDEFEITPKAQLFGTALISISLLLVIIFL